MMWVPKVHEDLCGAGGWDSSAPGLPRWLRFEICLCSTSPSTSRSSMLHSSLFFCGSDESNFGSTGANDCHRGHPTACPDPLSNLSRKLLGARCVFGSVSSGNWRVSTEMPCTQLTSQASDGNESGYQAGPGNTRGWACSGDLVGRRTGKRDLRCMCSADRHRPVIQTCDLDLSVLPCAQEKETNFL